MALDSRLIIASDLQSLFRDKDTGLPLRNGVIYFWKDAARTEPKDVYKLAGSPPNYSYTNIGSQITLTAAGTMSDNENPANDIILYYFPYEGTPDESENTVELYYVEVYSEGGKTSGVLQFTREAWPNVVTTASSAQDLENYAPNGQFVIHTDIAAEPYANPPLVAGEVRQAITDLAQGGWTFERPIGSVAKDIVLFKPFVSFVTNPSASPQYYIEIENESPAAGDGYKDLRLKFDDVNKFASDTDLYTFAFWGRSNGGGSVNVALILIKDYGSGGSPTEEISLANLVITNSFTVVQKSGFAFNDNSNKTIGSGSFIQLALRFPTGSLFSVSLTDFILTPGSITVVDFPQTTDRQFAAESITPGVPAHDGSNLYLPLVLGAQGLIYDDACIGDKVEETQLSVYVNSLHPTSNRMLADGSQYETGGYSPLGIPYARLQAKYWDSTVNAPIYGTGADYLTANISALSPATQLRIATNKAASTTNIADGATPTNFTFATAHTGANYNITAYRIGADKVMAVSPFVGVVPNATAGTSGFTVSEVFNQAARKHVFDIETIAATTLAGKYFTWNDPALFYYMWFTVDGAGSDPAVPGGTGIKVDLLSTYGADEVACFVLEAMSGYQISTVVTTAANTITAGAYFVVDTATESFYVWYKVGGAGADPNVSGKKGIEVDVASTDTAEQVAIDTQKAINRKYFAAPNFQGLFFRAYDPNQDYDVDALSRFGKLTSVYGNQIGSLQWDLFLSHSHQSPGYTGAIDDAGGPPGATDIGTAQPNLSTSFTGGNETRGVNATVNVAILY